MDWRPGSPFLERDMAIALLIIGIPLLLWTLLS